jgi:hypothetical protein
LHEDTSFEQGDDVDRGDLPMLAARSALWTSREKFMLRETEGQISAAKISNILAFSMACCTVAGQDLTFADTSVANFSGARRSIDRC